MQKEKKAPLGAACVMPNTYSQIYIQILEELWNQIWWKIFVWLDRMNRPLLRSFHAVLTFLSTNRSPLLGLHCCFFIGFFKNLNCYE